MSGYTKGPEATTGQATWAMVNKARAERAELVDALRNIIKPWDGTPLDADSALGKARALLARVGGEMDANKAAVFIIELESMRDEGIDPYPCKFGHIGCSTYRGGPCYDELCSQFPELCEVQS